MDPLSNAAESNYSSYLKNSVLGGIIYLQDITSDRPHPNIRGRLSLLGLGCGIQKAFDNVVLGTTKWNIETPDDRYSQRELKLQSKYWKPLITRGSAMLRFEDSSESASKFIDAVLRQATDYHGIVLDIPRGPVDEKRDHKVKGSKIFASEQGGYDAAKKGVIPRIRKFFGLKVRPSVFDLYFVTSINDYASENIATLRYE